VNGYVSTCNDCADFTANSSQVVLRGGSFLGSASFLLSCGALVREADLGDPNTIAEAAAGTLLGAAMDKTSQNIYLLQIKYEIAIRVQGTRGNAEVDGVMTRTVTINEVGKTKIELPAGAKKALE
jgi:hypothetical protein